VPADVAAAGVGWPGWGGRSGVPLRVWTAWPAALRATYSGEHHHLEIHTEAEDAEVYEGVMQGWGE